MFVFSRRRLGAVDLHPSIDPVASVTLPSRNVRRATSRSVRALMATNLHLQSRSGSRTKCLVRSGNLHDALRVGLTSSRNPTTRLPLFCDRLHLPRHHTRSPI